MTPKFPNLEVISDAQKDNSHSTVERRRIPRLDLFKDQFRLEENHKVFSVLNLSLEGMALRVLEAEDLVHFTVGRELSGILNVHGHKISVKAHVQYIRQTVIGCFFKDLEEKAKEVLQKYLCPKRLGAELHRVPPGDFASAWFHGSSGTDLLFWEDEQGRPQRISLFVLGSFVQWDLQEGLVTGRAEASDESSETLGVVRLATTLMDPDPQADPSKLDIAKNLILSSNIPQEIKDLCAERLLSAKNS